MSAAFQPIFDDWIDEIFSREVPEEIVAYNFNLSEPWCIELVGCGSFDPEDEDWGCDEVFRPEIPDELDLPAELFGDHWETVLERASQLVMRYLDRDSEGSRKLKSSKAVAIGFVDGNLTVLWTA